MCSQNPKISTHLIEIRPRSNRTWPSIEFQAILLIPSWSFINLFNRANSNSTEAKLGLYGGTNQNFFLLCFISFSVFLLLWIEQLSSISIIFSSFAIWRSSIHISSIDRKYVKLSEFNLNKEKHHNNIITRNSQHKRYRTFESFV